MSSSTSDAKKQLFTLEGAHNYLAWHTTIKAFLQMTGSWTYADNDVTQGHQEKPLMPLMP